MLREIQEIARELDIAPDCLKQYGKWIAKISLGCVNEQSERPKGKLVLVSAVTPTPAGEGKTVTAIGLSMGLNRIGHKSIVCLRQPSLGPVFGVKGGAAGGGRSTVEPMEEVNLGLTGDIDAVSAAHNLLSAMIDNHIYHGNSLGLDINAIIWKRTLDVNDRALRHVTVGLGSKNDGVPRADGFIISAASEVMAILCVAKSYHDLKERLGRIIVGYTALGRPVFSNDLKVAGAMAALLRNALQPNILQTIEGTPALVHGGPFGNIALGTCTLGSIAFALNHSGFAVVEAGFATDLGAEKFVDVVARVGGFDVDCAVIVVSIRALKHHAGAPDLERTNKKSEEESPGCLHAGLQNLAKHIENVRVFGIEPMVAINHFSEDTEEEVKVVEDFCNCQGVTCVVSRAFEEGGEGCVELAEKIVEASKIPHLNRRVYNLDDGIKEKISKIASEIYGASNVEYDASALEELALIEKLGMDTLPICMAKTQLSLSDDPKKLGRPVGFTCKVRSIIPAFGAGYVIADLGSIIAMPGLPANPAAEVIDLDDDGRITGVF